MIEINYQMNENGFQTTTEYGEIVSSGEDKHGFRPYFLMVTSIVSCSGGRLRKEIESLGVPYENMEVKADVTRKLEEANRIEKVHLTFKFKSKELSMSTLEKAMKDTYKKSSMLRTIEGCIKITDTLKIE